MAATAAARRNSKTNAPAHKVRVGGTTATVWLNEGENGRTFYNTTVVRSYKDDSDEYVETNSYLETQLLELAAAAQIAHAWIVQKQAEDRTAERRS